MYNIEDKIKSWFKNNVWNPVVSSIKSKREEKNEENKDGEETTATKPNLTVFTDEELNKQAHDSLVGEYNLKKTDLKNDLDLTVERLKDKSLEKIKDIESQREGIENYYDLLNKKTVNDSVKQGLSRSSILNEQVDKNNSDKEKEFSDIESKIASVLSSSQKEVDYYDKKYKNAVDSLDSQFAIDVKNRYEKLKAEQDKKIEEYNKQQEKEENGKTDGETSDNTENPNTGNSDEKEYNQLLEKYKNVKLEDIDINEFNKLKEKDKIAVRQAVFDDVLAYYYSMSPSEAKEAYKNDERIKQILGDYTVVLERYLNSYK